MEFIHFLGLPSVLFRSGFPLYTCDLQRFRPYLRKKMHPTHEGTRKVQVANKRQSVTYSHPYSIDGVCFRKCAPFSSKNRLLALKDFRQLSVNALPAALAHFGTAQTVACFGGLNPGRFVGKVPFFVATA
jgi:hypothetical protein